MAQDNDIYVYDEGDLRKYRTEIPNLIDDMNLSPHAYRLYGHLKRVAGAGEGSCWQNTETLAQVCHMSTGMVSRAKAELVTAGLIVVGKRRVGKNDVDNIRIIDIWAQNFAAYSSKSATPSHKKTTPSQYERVPSVTPSQYETKKEPLEEGTIKETTFHVEKSNNDFSRAATGETPQQQPLLPADTLSNTPSIGNDKSQQGKKRREKKPPNPNTKPILDAYYSALGYQQVFSQADAAAAKKLADAGYTPENVTIAYSWMMQQDFWREKPHVSLATIANQIGGIMKKLGTASSPETPKYRYLTLENLYS